MQAMGAQPVAHTIVCGQQQGESTCAASAAGSSCKARQPKVWCCSSGRSCHMVQSPIGCLKALALVVSAWQGTCVLIVVCPEAGGLQVCACTQLYTCVQLGGVQCTLVPLMRNVTVCADLFMV
jgi:hypothetical protein